MAGLGEVIEVLKGANVEGLGTTLDHLQVKHASRIGGNGESWVTS
jgi:hypothetical protein